MAIRLKNKDIAKKLGISTTTVSLAINDRPGVSEETRKKVLKLLKDTSKYIDDEMPDNELKQRSILLSIHKKHGKIINDKPFFDHIVESVQQEVKRKGYSLIISHYYQGMDIQQYIDYILSLSIEGMIVMATELDWEDLNYYNQIKIPFVLMDGRFEMAEIDSIVLDNQTAFYREVDYAYKMGHRQIGYLRSSISINNFGDHYIGFLHGLYTYGLENENHPIIDLPCDVENAYAEMKSFLMNPPDDFKMPTIFLADLDYIAVGAMKALTEMGYRVPEDVSMIGYDDVVMTSVCEPPLTTTKVNRMDIGKVAAKRLIEKIKDPSDYYSTIHISSELIIRGSVKKIGE